MIVLYFIFLCLFLIDIKYTKKDFNKQYLSKDTTTIISGLFVITIFFSHFKGYIDSANILDISLSKILNMVGQLMVSTFLFYSGYGICESIKSKENYMKHFFRNRLIPTFLNFVIAVCLFLVMDMMIGKTYDNQQILLSFIGYESIGNSNWYMFATFVLYLLTKISFSGVKDRSQKKKFT
ncbi:MAG: hypothetical protein IJ215_05190 [Clostridia bacterium]|nr:hypothetical protein [Clostridia bacterium]